MSELTTDGERGDATHERQQSGLQIWIACVLFVLVPVLLILLVKYLFGL